MAGGMAPEHALFEGRAKMGDWHNVYKPWIKRSWRRGNALPVWGGAFGDACVGRDRKSVV